MTESTYRNILLRWKMVQMLSKLKDPDDLVKTFREYGGRVRKIASDNEWKVSFAGLTASGTMSTITLTRWMELARLDFDKVAFQLILEDKPKMDTSPSLTTPEGYSVKIAEADVVTLLAALKEAWAAGRHHYLMLDRGPAMQATKLAEAIEEEIRQRIYAKP